MEFQLGFTSFISSTLQTKLSFEELIFPVRITEYCLPQHGEPFHNGLMIDVTEMCMEETGSIRRLNSSLPLKGATKDWKSGKCV